MCAGALKPVSGLAWPLLRDLGDDICDPEVHEARREGELRSASTTSL